jgi:hypothetical protein
LLALALVAAGCGKSKERELYEQRLAACAQVQGLTVLEARRLLLNGLTPDFCSTGPEELLRIDETDTCGGAPSGPYTESVCRLLAIWSANDPSLCDPENGCVYFCEIRIDLADVAVVNGAFVFDDAPVCARRWIP